MSNTLAWDMRSVEAGEIDRHDRDHDPETHVPLVERIESRTREARRPPSFLRKVLDRTSYSELLEILDQLWALNEEHVGERTREAEVVLCVSGKDRPLRDRLLAWCRSYVAQRLSKQDPKDQSDPFRQFNRLVEEFNEILSLFGQENTLDYVFTHDCITLVLSLLFDGTFKQTLAFRPDGTLVIMSRPTDPALARRCVGSVQDLIRGGDGLNTFLTRVRRSADPARLGQIRSRSEETLLGELESLAAGIQEMRPFLVRNFDPAKTLVELGEGFTVAWSWTLVSGIADLIAGDSMRSVLERLTTHHARWKSVVGHDGHLCDPLRPWVRTPDRTSPDGSDGLAENVYILEIFHDKLLGFYARIDFDRIRRRAERTDPQSAEESQEVVDADETFALSYQDLARKFDVQDAEIESGKPKGYRIALLRIESLVRLLRAHFGCEVSQGKGSEIKIHRPGFKQFVLGCHGKNPQVPSVVVRRLLRALSISEEEWMRAVYS